MGWLDLSVVALTFVLIFPAELPDKTFIATLVLSTRYRRVPVWIGVAVAFAVQCAIAVAAGGLLSLLPQRIVLGITFCLFAAGSVLLLVSGFRARPRAWWLPSRYWSADGFSSASLSGAFASSPA